MNVKNYLIATMLSAIVLALMFIPFSGSQTTPQYDPWMDINDDGRIDARDITTLVINFMATGDPVNKTALLLELLSKIDSLNASLVEHECRILELETKLTELEAELATLNATKLGKPDYDSFEDPEVGGWKYLQPDIPWRFDHHLNTTNVIVYLVFSNDSIGTNINHHWYGGQNSGTWWGGAWWSELTKDYIMVTRYAHSNECAYVRVMIWKIPE